MRIEQAARIVALLMVLLSLPASAADYSPWVDEDQPFTLLAQSAYPGRYCCVHCRANEIPCNGQCMGPKSSGKKAFCKAPPGCACPGKP